ncbi:MAG: sodium:alanine symporter family protein [Robiginitomaculum sp.]|nr:MAG: sodium:alanine symporter family protein [Robiginitomaculum sp.]
MEKLISALETVDGWIWGPPLVILLFGTGLYLTIGLRFMPIRRLPYAITLLFSGKKASGSGSEGEISPVAALFTALSATIGTGNIAGVATAITIGGPGAVFWMWMTAVVGMATKYSEALLAVRFREVDERGIHVGGPMYYIKNGMGKNWVWLAFAFAILTAIAAPGTGNLVQANGVAALLHDNLDIATWISGLVMAVMVFMVIMGGVKSIAKVASFLVPIMALFYVGGALIVLTMNAEFIPAAFGQIFEGVVSPSAAAGGFLGASIMMAISQGANRGSFSNEAGLGSAAIAHASANTNDPVRQGTIAMLGTFIDTLVVCTMTALVILTAPMIFAAGGATGGSLPVWQSGIASAASVTANAFGASIPGGQWIVTIGLAVFAFTTILGWALYGERSMEFLFGVKVIPLYRVAWCVVVYLGAVYSNDLAWTLASIGNGMMAAPNLIALLGLSGIIFAMTRKHQEDERAAKQSPAE